MKTKSVNLILLLCMLVGLLTACYDDKSTLANMSIDELQIKTDGEQSLYVGYLESLDLAPEIYRGDKLFPEGLEYEWEIGDEASTTPDSYTKLGTDANLHAIINNAISNTPYYLRLTVTDKENADLQAVQYWKVYVQSAFLDGLLISDTKDNATSDLTLIESKDLTLNYDQKEEKIYRNILSEANGAPYSKLMTSLTYESYGYINTSHVNQVWAITKDGDCVRFDTKDFSINGNSDSESMLIYKPENMQFYKVFTAGSNFLAYTSNGWYNIQLVAANVLGWTDADAQGYQIDNNCVAKISDWSMSNAIAVWFDANKGCFVSYDGAYSSPKYFSEYQSNSYFEPQNMSGYTAIAAGMTTDGTVPAFVMKEKSSGNYSICTLTRYLFAEGYYDDDWNWYETTPEVPASARMKYDIPLEGKTLLDKAVSVFFANNESILYVVTSDGIYSIDFAGSRAVVSTASKYSVSSGEKITMAKLYTQGDYSIASDFVENLLPLNNKAIVVATQKSEFEGKVYVLPMTQLGTGNLDVSKALSYDGFGKILDLTTIGY